jgi:putative lipoic acid-binding regulatory protein
MGVTINETITLSNGLTVTNPYASLATNDIRMEKRVEEVRDFVGETEKVSTTTKYILDGHFTMWLNKEMRDSNKGNIGGIHVSIESTTPFTGNVYDALYNKLKTMKTCTDAI